MDSMSIAAAAILFAIGVVWYLRVWRQRNPAAGKRHAANALAGDPTPAEGLERMEQAISELVAELKTTAQRNIQELAGWTAQMNELVRAADERITALRALQQGDSHVVTKPAPDAEVENESPPLMAESSPITLAEAAHRLSAEITDEGEIAKRLGVSRGELRLLFALRQRKEAGAVS
ncbi:MAG: hypothetical protein GTO55_08810 [Armatimonadetes bacterium]|nr:hypothetical protein [Armatimonadota bacterium]NIM24347.1 hypothetical protein [Armatimonadota bacterium]NIM68216.1 hypothetical protein [Armatimonadota bacterium]NIM75117.1 hypothetical protein [Armatimonadota bacterium]NIN06421.1 hypothetical protein [Armatimonadota bacterium]